MNSDEVLENEESLDPKDWQAMRQLGYRMIDDMMRYLESVRDRPVWRPTPGIVKQKLKQPLPARPEGPEKAYQDFIELVLPYPTGNIHPRFWGYVNGTGTPLGMLAEMLAAGMNSNVGVGDHSAVHVELQVIDWCKEMLGYPAQASGILVSGGSMANLVGLTVARNTQSKFDIRKHGVRTAPGMLTVYCSKETHSSVQKAIELLGLGSEAMRMIATDDEYRIDVSQLKKQILEDRTKDHIPFCVIGNAGTINTGAIDPLNELADFCQNESLWFHVDGAFGAVTALVPEFRYNLIGMERADSIAFDLHKWMYMPYEVGCTLVRDQEAHQNAFTLVPDYLVAHDGGLSAGPPPFSNFGFQLSRGFRALKVWLSIKEHGIDKYRRLIQQNIAQAQFLTQLVEANSQLELLAPVSLNIVCFRYTCNQLDLGLHNQLNRELLIQLHEQGIALPTSTILGGRYAIRVAITNHRSKKRDFELLVRETLRLGNELVNKL